jgi:hypothetical protein
MRLARRFLSLSSLALLSFGGVALGQTPGTPLGIVGKAVSAHIGNTPVSEGATVYSGDHISTDDSGSLQVNIGKLTVELQANSSAHIYTAPYGAVVELNSGSILYSTPGGGSNVVIVASDVRVTPVLGMADFGRVAIEDKCNVQVQSEKGQADVRVGSEAKTVEQGKSYRVRAENSLSYRDYVSPEANNYHDYHQHSPCAALYQNTKGGHLPIAPGQDRFLYLAIGTAVVVTTIPIIKSFESPARP